MQKRDWASLAKVAEAFGVHKNSVRQWVKTGKLKEGRHYFVTPSGRAVYCLGQILSDWRVAQ